MLDGVVAKGDKPVALADVRRGRYPKEICALVGGWAFERCAATNVNPETAERDMNLPLTLRKGFGHMDMGVYAKVVSGGQIAPGDAVTLSSA